jgi:uncharacterized protein YecA (UPF0149 family)
MEDHLVHSLISEMIHLPLKQQEERLLSFRQSPTNVEQLVYFVKREIDKIERQTIDEIDENDSMLYVVLHLLSYLEETEGFSQFIRLIHVDEEKLDLVFGSYFMNEQGSYLFASFAPNWIALKPIIENPEINLYWRVAALESLLYLVIKGKASRQEVSQYLKHLLQTMINQEHPHKELVAFLILTCGDFYPTEMMEEIREAYGRWAVDLSIIDIECVQRNLERGEEFAIAELKKRLKSHHPLDMIRLSPEEKSSIGISDSEKLEELEDIARTIDKETEESKSSLPRIHVGRNDPCPCGSGKKYKKCCLPSQSSHKISEVSNKPQLKFLSSIITFEPINDSNLENQLTPSEFEEVVHFRLGKLYQDPKEALQFLLPFKEKYPNIPCFYNWLYATYVNNKQIIMGLNILRETLNKFPNYLFGLTEYGKYLLRRGEYDRIPKLLNKNFSLETLYPERDVFHITEVSAFYSLMIKYFLAKKDIQQAKIYFKILDELIPDEQITNKLRFDIQKAERKSAFDRFLEAKKNNFTIKE